MTAVPLSRQLSRQPARRPSSGPAAESPPSLYAAVLFGGDDRSTVTEVVILFESAAAADGYAMECGWDDYAVGAVRFHLPPRIRRVRWVA
ncbi:MULTISPECIES: hypothetical protein [Protofrankia]|uniref:Uncharacterized protein n=1 Tax=Protofrankia coriariae TaxID=1562887 RepID=A0ABR5F5Y7_9ACTN|nr:MULTISPECIES: hypothetical protein [Protofrankia]KLL12134.1 hypothetical protein FrCorBMG51_06705 [Protofrankia coriariae]ONH37024.1 hypothetical protein BL254_05040 [Protofrankia sp. BMG5.30]